jgi:hypothetical protein
VFRSPYIDLAMVSVVSGKMSLDETEEWADIQYGATMWMSKWDNEKVSSSLYLTTLSPKIPFNTSSPQSHGWSVLGNTPLLCYIQSHLHLQHISHCQFHTWLQLPPPTPFEDINPDDGNWNVHWNRKPSTIDAAYFWKPKLYSLFWSLRQTSAQKFK